MQLSGQVALTLLLLGGALLAGKFPLDFVPEHSGMTCFSACFDEAFRSRADWKKAKYPIWTIACNC
jgi:hypothetical protein